MRTPCWILAGLAALPVLRADPARVLVIGDSMSEEYAHELPFSAPDSNPTNPNTVNWVEILDAFRGPDLDFGTDGVYLFDLRVLGFKYNWGFPGATAEFWKDVFDSGFFDDPLYIYLSKLTLLGQVDDVDVVVLFLGGNDVSSDYGNLYNNAPSPGLKSDFLAHIAFIVAELRAERSPGQGDLPIVLVNVPDVGVTPDIQEDHPDPVKRADASAHIADLNAQLADQVAGDAHTHIVDLFALTTEVYETTPFFIGTVEMIKSYHPENPPEYLFCKLKLHPASGFQALIGNIIVEGINAALDRSIAPLPPREIVSRVLRLDPDQPFLDWIATFPGADTDLFADDDRDGLPNIGEFALQKNPLVTDPLPAPTASGGAMVFPYHHDPAAARLVDTTAEESTGLLTWWPVPPERLTTLLGDHVQVTLPAGPRAFARLRFTLTP